MKKDSLLKRLFGKKPSENDEASLHDHDSAGYIEPDTKVEGAESFQQGAEESREGNSSGVDSQERKDKISGNQNNPENPAGETEGKTLFGFKIGRSEGGEDSREESEAQTTVLAERDSESDPAGALVQDPKATPQVETSLRLSEGLGELSSLLKNISTKLEERSGITKEMAGHIQELPAIVRQIPKATEAQTEVLKTISDRMTRQGKTTEAFLERFGSLPEILRELPEAAKLQADVLRKMTQQMEGQSNQVVGSLGELTKASESQVLTLKELRNTQQDSIASFKTGQNKALNIFYRAQKETLIAFKRSQEEQGRQFQRLIQSALKSNSKMLLIFFLAVLVVISIALILNIVVLNVKPPVL